jgi:uncharacterized membrane protein (DUF2068 family)
MRSGSSNAGLRAVAVVEGAKGLSVLAAGLGLLSLIHRDVQRLAEELVRQFHLNPASGYPRIFIQAVGSLTEHRLWLLACGALIYSTLRLIEAYGLWRARRWAEWFGVVTGGIYVPIEIYELFHGVTWTKLLLLSVNIVVVGYLVLELGHREQACANRPDGDSVHE